MDKKIYCVYILTNFTHTTLYTGVTGDLPNRILQHKSGTGGKFTHEYHVNKLVYYETHSDPESAILREKQIKAGSRQKKLDLINEFNPEWRDLSDDFY
jgi:putative endonuclease